ncbi:MAG: prolipoprotein diacylglyceryl transferase [Clostridia bacterium]|nr:prolipoprotein diacylglyceryl transferase [Clostridia bacterium]
MNYKLLQLISGFKIFGLEIKFYGILMASAFVIGLFLAMKYCKQKGYSENIPYELLIIVFPTAIVGARLNYVLFTLSERTWSFVDILSIWHGGLMIYGGVIFSVIAIAIYCHFKKISFVAILDMLAPILILGQAIGRWGNFFNQEAYGSLITNSSFQWFPFGVYIENSHFTTAASQQVADFYGTTAIDGVWFNATFFYESIWCLGGFFLLHFLFKKTKQKGLCTATYLAYYGFERFFVEQLRTDSLYIGSVRVSVLISGLIFLLGTGLLIYFMVNNYKSKKKTVPESNAESNNNQSSQV